MAKCSTCKGYGHNKSKHIVKCIICGTVGETKDTSDEGLRVAKETYRCSNTDLHATIKGAWSLPRVVAGALLRTDK